MIFSDSVSDVNGYVYDTHIYIYGYIDRCMCIYSIAFSHMFVISIFLSVMVAVE